MQIQYYSQVHQLLKYDFHGGHRQYKRKNIIAIGPITAAELDKNNIECSSCDEYSINGIIDKLLDLN